MTVCPTDDRHVAVLAFPYGTHATPLLNLVRRVAAEAPQVTFSTKKSNASVFAGLNKEQLFNIKPYDVDDGLPDNYVPSGNPKDAVAFFVKAMPANYRTALDEAVAKTGRHITCLVSDAFFLVFVLTWLKKCMQIRENKEVDFLTGFSGVKASDLPEGLVEEPQDPFSIMLEKLGEALPRATAVAINSFATVHLPIAHELESKLHKLLNVGQFILTTPQALSSPDEDGCLPWLNKQEEGSVVYLSFGSSIMPPPHELAAIAEALEEGKYPFIWAFRGNPEKQLPQGFLERTKTQGKVLLPVCVCMTHGGWNSVLDCIVGGVPMISRPFFGDQMLNTATMERVWEIGVELENGVFTKEGILRALELIMSSEKGKMTRQKIVELKDFAMAAGGPEGGSTKNFGTFSEIVGGSSYEQLNPQQHGYRGIRNKIAGAFAAANSRFTRRNNPKHQGLEAFCRHKQLQG
uniref:Glycosyltransferase n=1 Tax=Glycine max TaxID=3847 RepID=A0A0R0F8R8_SOYBN